MTPEERDRWNGLCQQAAQEKDLVKLTELLTEILRMLHEDQDRTLQKNAS
jgi:hypothetical protein